jgi:hypothetical protein
LNVRAISESSSKILLTNAGFKLYDFKSATYMLYYITILYGIIKPLHSRVSQTYITTNQWGIELSSNASRDIRNGNAW